MVGLVCKNCSIVKSCPLCHPRHLIIHPSLSPHLISFSLHLQAELSLGLKTEEANLQFPFLNSSLINAKMFTVTVTVTVIQWLCLFLSFDCLDGQKEQPVYFREELRRQPSRPRVSPSLCISQLMCLTGDFAESCFFIVVTK